MQEKQNTAERLQLLFSVLSAVPALVGLVFILLAMFGPVRDESKLSVGLCCILGANVFNLVRILLKKKAEKNHK